MRKRCIHTFIAVSLLSTVILSNTAQADYTFGLGVGSLYNGIGINFGISAPTSLTFGSLGCLSLSYGTTGDGEGGRGSDEFDSKCGIGLGYVSNTLLPGHRNALGLSLGLNNNSIEKRSTTVEYIAIPSYNFFFNGLNNRGFNLGAGPKFTFRENASMHTGFVLNLGFQF